MLIINYSVGTQNFIGIVPQRKLVKNKKSINYLIIRDTVGFSFYVLSLAKIFAPFELYRKPMFVVH